MNQITCVVITVDLSDAMQWILLGQNQNLTSESPNNSFKNCVSSGTQFIMQLSKLVTILRRAVHVMSATTFGTFVN